jgi:ribosomal protein S27AE
MKDIHVPPMLADLVQAALSVCDGAVFSRREKCPECGGALSGYDMKKKKFAVIRNGTQKRALSVQVKRFTCQKCGIVCFADQPFYPDTRIGSPIIDLCVTLGESMSYARAAAYLECMGIVVDRWSIRNYHLNTGSKVPTVAMFGIRLPMTIVALSVLATKDKGEIDTDTVLVACRYPSTFLRSGGSPDKNLETVPKDGTKSDS